jgi:hypothetical protein
MELRRHDGVLVKSMSKGLKGGLVTTCQEDDGRVILERMVLGVLHGGVRRLDGLLCQRDVSASDGVQVLLGNLRLHGDVLT